MKILITGASSGMGRDMARYLSTYNFDLYLVSKDKKKLDKEFKNYKNKIKTYSYDLSKEEETRKQRIASLYSRDKETKIKCSHHNPQIQKMYQEFLGKPGSKLSEELLHTSYYKR